MPKTGTKRDPALFDGRLFLCGKCAFESHCPGPLLDHLRDGHGLDRAVLQKLTGEVSHHLDARDWYETVRHYRLEGEVVMVQRTRYGRRQGMISRGGENEGETPPRVESGC
jgi:hypothetical protein